MQFLKDNFSFNIAHKERRNSAFIKFRYSKGKAKQRNDKERMIQQEYEEATRRFEKDLSDYNRARLNEIKEEMELFYEEKTNGIIVRARARWHEHRERSTKYFLNLERRNHVKKHIRKLVISGAITTDPYQILSEQKKFITICIKQKR